MFGFVLDSFLPNNKSMFGKRLDILNGISSILLTFDESEVRKLVETCKKVYQYLFVSVDIIEEMDDLVDYIKVYVLFCLPPHSPR